jgi:hypothetical protein
MELTFMSLENIQGLNLIHIEGLIKLFFYHDTN